MKQLLNYLESGRHVLADFVTKCHQIFVLINWKKNLHCFKNHSKDIVVWELNLNIKKLSKSYMQPYWLFWRRSHIKHSALSLTTHTLILTNKYSWQSFLGLIIWTVGCSIPFAVNTRPGSPHRIYSSDTERATLLWKGIRGLVGKNFKKPLTLMTKDQQPHVL